VLYNVFDDQMMLTKCGQILFLHVKAAFVDIDK